MNQWYPWSFSSEDTEEKNDQNNKNTQNRPVDDSFSSNLSVASVNSVSDDAYSSVVSPSASVVAQSFNEVDELLADEGLVVNTSDNNAGQGSVTGGQEVINPRLVLLRHALEEVRDTINKALDILSDEIGGGAGVDMGGLEKMLHSTYTAMPVSMPINPSNEGGENGRVIEGVFDGQAMVGSDGKQYSVPANYASKSKLVEGDVMKLTIAPQGTFVYKQIGPVERKRVIARLEQNPDTHEFSAVSGETRWKILTASVTYFKGITGDEVVILVPQNALSKWAAVENIIKKL